MTFACDVQLCEKNTQAYITILQAMENKFGNVVSLLRSLPDFHLFCLKPQSGQYIIGFGQAYPIDVVNQCVLPIQTTN